MDWKVLTFLVCLYGVLKEYRPSEAYLTAYLTGPWQNLTEEQVDNEVYPVWTYSYLVWLVPVFLLTDFLRYQPMLVVGGAAYVSTWALLLWAKGVPAMKGMQITFGLVSATEVAYYSYLFSMISGDRYQVITSFTRAATLIGRLGGYLTGQLLVSFNLMDYHGLNIISFTSVSLVLILSLFFKRPTFSSIFHKRSNTNDTNKDSVEIELSKIGLSSNITNPSTNIAKFKQGLLYLWNELKVLYTDKSVVLWCCWWAFASCGHLQVSNYIQNLWKVISPEKKGTLYNGGAEAFGTFISAGSVLIFGFLPINWLRPGLSETVMSVVCLFNTVVLIIMAQTTSIWACYAFYSAFRATYHTVITLATLQIAKSLTKQRYGFVFGVNTFITLVIETLLTVIVVDKAGLDVNVRTQSHLFLQLLLCTKGLTIKDTIFKETTICEKLTVEAELSDVESLETPLEISAAPNMIDCDLLQKVICSIFQHKNKDSKNNYCTCLS